MRGKVVGKEGKKGDVGELQSRKVEGKEREWADVCVNYSYIAV